MSSVLSLRGNTIYLVKFLKVVGSFPCFYQGSVMEKAGSLLFFFKDKTFGTVELGKKLNNFQATFFQSILNSAFRIVFLRVSFHYAVL